MKRIEMLLKNLHEQKVKLEVRRTRFVSWQEEIEKLDEEGRATFKQLEKSTMYWRKQLRLEDRIEFIDNKISAINREKLII